MPTNNITDTANQHINKDPVFNMGLESFVSKQKEKDFNHWELNDNRSVILGLLVVAMITVLMFMLSGFLFQVNYSNDLSIQLFRFSIFILLIYFYYLMSHKITVVNYQWVSFLLFVAIACLEFFSIAIRPRDYITHVGIDLSIIIFAYIGTNMAVKYQLAITIPYSIVILCTLFLYKEVQYNITYYTFIISIVLANIFGYWVSVRQGRIRRISYQHLLNEKNARAKIKTLEEFLPICGYCKKIRDNDGSWEQIETYISNHSESEFSHGICPDCLPNALENNFN